MPLYVFECKKCKAQWEEITRYDEAGKYPGVRCPNCKSKRKDRVICGTVNFQFSQPVGTDRFNNHHDYRHKWNMDRPGGVRDQRKQAEDKSHMGTEPYNPIDDVSSGENFGEVK